MHSAGPGTLLAGRYALRRRVSQGRDVEHWSAHDRTLERDVALTIIDSAHPNRAGVLDAARRAAGVEDSRLVRILDVGTQEGSSFIVEEAMSGAQSLATILLQGPLPAEESRRIAGETARGLETAGQRGLHHLRLTPHCVLIAPDGAVRVNGVAVDAAIDGPDGQEPDPATAARRDVVCVVAVVYAALTGRWPLTPEVSGVEPAPRVVDGPAAPSEIVAGVPGDLDALCRMMLNKGTGPATPGDFADQIAPWSAQRVDRAGVEPILVRELPELTELPGDALAGAEPVDEVWTQAAGGGHATAADADTETGRDTALAGVGASASGARASASGAAESPGIAGPSAGEAEPPAGGVVGRQRPSSGSAERAGRAEAGAGSGETRSERSPVIFTDIEPPLPLLPASTALPPSRGQTKIVVALVAAFVVLALLVGYRGLIGPGDGTDTVKPQSTAAVTSAPVAVPSSTAPLQGTAGGPIAILSATGFDPEGDRTENNGQAARVYDGNLATVWTSEGYRSAEFGNLKSGVGVLLDLGQPTSIHLVTLQLGSGPVDVAVSVATKPALDGATEIGAATAASGRIQLKATQTMPAAQYVIVWFTKLARGGGQFRASISEIALS